MRCCCTEVLVASLFTVPVPELIGEIEDHLLDRNAGPQAESKKCIGASAGGDGLPTGLVHEGDCQCGVVAVRDIRGEGAAKHPPGKRPESSARETWRSH